MNLKKAFRAAKWIAGLALIGLPVILLTAYISYQGLPDTDALQDVQLQVPLRIVSKDGEVMGIYGDKRRLPMRIEQVPHKLKLAIIATEDRRFYEHNGVDLRGLIRASVNLIKRGRKEQGASTITMQVARNFYLSREKTFSRKFQEILLAIKIDRELPKDKILELYLNKIYFGKNAYGVGAAAQVYYGLPVEDLNLAQMAMIAGLPQAPSAINPLNNPRGARIRRNHVLDRMMHYGFITAPEHLQASAAPITAQYHARAITLHAPYVAETVRQQLLEQYGSKIYTDGWTVVTTIDAMQQRSADLVTQTHLLDYDRRHGWRGPIGHIDLADIDDDNQLTLFQDRLALIPSVGPLKPAVLVDASKTEGTFLLGSGTLSTLTLKDINWARVPRRSGGLGPVPSNFNSFLTLGDVVYLMESAQQWKLAQVPELSAALVALCPNSGEILATTGGFDFEVSHFNRAFQARRQVGSVLKPFIYTAALANGFTAATVINDAPIVQTDPSLEAGHWRPQNASKIFYGPTRLRLGIVKSRNLVSIRLLESLGIDRAIEFLTRFGFKQSEIPRGLAIALGANLSTPVDLAAAYAVFANGGHRIQPHLIHHIENDEGQIIYIEQPTIVCDTCEVSGFETFKPAPRVVQQTLTYIMTAILQDAVKSGAQSLNRQYIAGKTGTTNNHVDNWFAGYTKDLVAVTWMGFDEPKGMGEYAYRTTLPFWVDFMNLALAGTPDEPWVQPVGLVTARIDPDTGDLAGPDQKDAIFELFEEGTEPMKEKANTQIKQESQRDGVLYDHSLF